MQTWIFQGNPDHFDVDRYLAACLPEFPWLVKKHAKDIEVGDKVFIWRSAGKKKGISGVVAETIVTGVPKPRHEDEFGKTLWRNGRPEGERLEVRAMLRSKRVASAREVLKLEWLKEDPLLRSLGIVGMPRRTNYRVEAQHAARLGLLWSRIGKDWTRNEALAGLWAYSASKAGSDSSLTNIPIAEAALLIGRSISDVYNKVLNFRSIDPNNRGGMHLASETDRRVWMEFSDPSTCQLRHSDIEDEFVRLWRSVGPIQGVPETIETDLAIVRLLEANDLGILRAKYVAERQAKPKRPVVKRVDTHAYDRDPLAVAITRKRAKFRCEVPACSHPTFTTADGVTYCEAHHIIPLSEGGEDTIENMACICPAHHREAHWGSGKAAITAVLLKVRTTDGYRRDDPTSISR